MERGSIIGIVAALIIVAIILFTVLRSPAETSGPTGQEPTTQVPVERPPPKELLIPVVVTKQFFNPAAITVNAGDVVRLQMTSQDLSHSVSVPEYGVAKTIPMGETVEVQFTPTATGTLQLLCLDNCDPSTTLTVTVK